MDYNIIEEQNIIEEPVVKRGRGRPRVIKQPKEPKKEEDQELKDHLRFSKRGAERQQFEQRSHKKNGQRNTGSSFSWRSQID